MEEVVKYQEDIEGLVKREGIEGALASLYDAGVHVALDEVKGRRSIRRPGLEIPVTSEDFDNPMLVRHFETQTSGSTGPRRRMGIDFTQQCYETAVHYVTCEAGGFVDRPTALWRTIPPGGAGIKNALNHAKMRRPIVRWFTPQPLTWRNDMWKSAIFLQYAVYASRVHGPLVPSPEYVPLGSETPIVRWLADQTRRGQPAALSAPVTGVVRLCQAAKETGMDISGTMFRPGGEPLTPAKHALIRLVGADAYPRWAMAECGIMAGGCTHGEVVDEMHVLSGKLAVLARPKSLSDGTTVNAIFLTTLLPAASKVMLNLESGDAAVTSDRRCGCPLEAIGFFPRVHTIRSYEKLTTAGMHFIGTELLRLIEEVLPAAFGGSPADYQLVEEERDDVNRVSVLVHPRLGPLDENEVVSTVLNFLGSHSRGERLMAEVWKDSGVVEVSRHEPHSNAGGKVAPLRVIRAQTPGCPGTAGQHGR